MTIKLYYIPNMNLLFHAVNNCAGHVYLELRDQSFLNMKNGGEGEFFLKNAGNRPNELNIVTEKYEDAGFIARSLM